MSKKVLLIEDSPTQAAKTRLVLEDRNYEVFIATSGSTGISQSQQLQPDLIVLDVNLPDMTGFEVCKVLTNTITLQALPIIMFSSENRLENMVRAYEMGADYYVVKGDEGERALTLLIETIFTRIARRVLQFS